MHDVWCHNSQITTFRSHVHSLKSFLLSLWGFWACAKLWHFSLEFFTLITSCWSPQLISRLRLLTLEMGLSEMSLLCDGWTAVNVHLSRLTYGTKLSYEIKKKSLKISVSSQSSLWSRVSLVMLDFYAFVCLFNERTSPGITRAVQEQPRSSSNNAIYYFISALFFSLLSSHSRLVMNKKWHQSNINSLRDC